MVNHPQTPIALGDEQASVRQEREAPGMNQTTRDSDNTDRSPGFVDHLHQR